MPKLNLVLMVVLSLGVSAGAALLALSGKGENRDEANIRILLRQLGDHDPDIRRDAERELKLLGAKAHPQLKDAAAGKDAFLAERARTLLDKMTSAVAAGTGKDIEKSATPEAPVEGPIEFQLQIPKTQLAKGEPLQFYLALSNGSRTARTFVRHTLYNLPFYAEFGRLEIIDPDGKTVALKMEAAMGSPMEEFLTVEAGGSISLFPAHSMVSGDALDGKHGEFKVRFVYDAGEGSAYRKALAQADVTAAALPNGRVVSNAVAIALE